MGETPAVPRTPVLSPTLSLSSRPVSLTGHLGASLLYFLFPRIDMLDILLTWQGPGAGPVPGRCSRGQQEPGAPAGRGCW